MVAKNKKIYVLVLSVANYVLLVYTDTITLMYEKSNELLYIRFIVENFYCKRYNEFSFYTF